MNHHGWGKAAACAIIALGAIRYAGAAITTGPDDELFFTGTAEVQENDNLFLQHSDVKSDTVFDLTPGVDWEFGKNSVNTAKFTAGDDFQIFATNSKLDTDLPEATFSDAYDDSKNKATLNVTYNKLDQATLDVHLNGLLIKRDYTHVDGTDEVSLTDKTSVSAGVVYEDTSYQQSGFENWEWFSIPVKYYYKIEPKLDLSAGFSYQNNVIGAPGVDSDEYFYNVGARGELADKLTGEFSVGFEQIEFKKGRSDNGLGATSTFNYLYSPKTTFNLAVSNGYAYSPVLGAAYRTFSVTPGVQSKLTDQWLVSANVGYSTFRYITTAEQDNYYTVGANVTYVISPYVSLLGGYHYTKDDSNILSNTFSNNIFSFSVMVKY